MARSGSEFLFNTIAPVYGLFFDYQRRQFAHSFQLAAPELDLSEFKSALDVGCGTGALAAYLADKGLSVTGADPAAGMLKIAKRKLKGKSIPLVQANVLERLPFADLSFDLSIASFVAHGLQPGERKKMYQEMGRVSRSKVVIYDYNQKRAVLTTVLEWLERGDYFRFIKQAEFEMRDCMSDLKQCFSSVEVIHVNRQAALYICTPTERTPSDVSNSESASGSAATVD